MTPPIDADPPAVAAALRRGEPCLVGAETMRVMAPELEVATNWLPVLPLRLAQEVEAARRCVDRGELGAIVAVSVTGYHGRPDTGGEYEVRPGTPFEAMVWALDLAEQLTGAEVTHTRWQRRPAAGEVSLAVHTLGGDIPVTAHHLPRRLGPVPAYSATVVAERGQLMLRHAFAPGALARWRADGRDIVVPALVKGTPAPGVPGGRECHLLLSRLQDANPDGDAWRAAALRLVRYLETDERERPFNTAEDS